MSLRLPPRDDRRLFWGHDPAPEDASLTLESETDQKQDSRPMQEMTEPELILDVMGQNCPLPVLRTKKRLANLEPGTLLRVFTTDPVSRVDLPHFCAESGHELLETRDRGSWIEFLIRRAAELRETSS